MFVMLQNMIDFLNTTQHQFVNKTKSFRLTELGIILKCIYILINY